MYYLPDENVGSVSFGWHGPPITDVYTSVALHVLFRYLQVFYLPFFVN